MGGNAANLRHGTDNFTSPSEGRRAEDFLSPSKNPTASAWFEPANLGIRGQHAISAPPTPLCNNLLPQQIKCGQLNVQHSRTATANLMQLIFINKIDMALIQEPYLYQLKITGLTKGYRTFSCGERKRRAAIIIQDKTIDVLLITQQSNEDAVLLEVQNGRLSFFAASAYFDYNEPIDNSIKIIERLLKCNKGKKTAISNRQQLSFNNMARHQDQP
jgi:hypothetical protein